MNDSKDKSITINKRLLYRDEIRMKLTDAIMNSDLKPGDRIVETRWAKELGVSQAPVREAIRELETMGIVENIPYQGSFVKNLTKKDLRDVYQVRMCLEAEGMRTAAREITDQQLSRVYDALIAMESSAQKKDYSEYICQDVLFHKYIMGVSDNEMLLRMWNQCNTRIWIHIGTLFSQQSIEMLAKRHRAIYDALSMHDEERVVREAKKHIQELMDLIESLPQNHNLKDHIKE